MSTLGVVILAAGKGTRMKSALPKVLHPVCGTPMALHVLAAAAALQPDRIAVVVGHEAAKVREAFAGHDVVFVEQTELLGTGDAVRRCQEALAGCDTVMVLNGDSPLITSEVLQRLVDARGDAPLAFLTCELDDTGRMGRVERDAAGAVTRIVEAADGDESKKAGEINAGQYLFDAAWLWSRVDDIEPSPGGEVYLTQLPESAFATGTAAAGICAEASVVLGFDDRIGLARAESIMRTRILEAHMREGVTIADPASTYIDADVAIASDVTILPNCYLRGATSIAADCVIGPGTTLEASRVGTRSIVKHSIVEDSVIGADVSIGPFSHVRGGANIGDGCYLGNYAEVKNSVLAPGVKMHHFSYVGDADLGEEVNFAAGAITCNFDGVLKHRTVIGAGAFIGCDTMLVAPITIGEGALTATGSVVIRDVAPGERVAGVPARPMAPRKA